MVDPISLFFVILVLPFTALPVVVTLCIGMFIDRAPGESFPAELGWITLGVVSYCAMVTCLVSRMDREGKIIGFTRTGWWALIGSATGVGLGLVVIMIINPR